MWLLRRVARSCGPILILFGVLLSFSHITLLRLLLPFRFIVAECLVAGGLASAAAWYLARRSAVLGFMQSVLLLCAVGGLIFGILQYRAESLAYRQTVISFEN